MKKILGLLLILTTIISLSACYTHGHRHGGKLPPGQAKKIYGDKSAKRHAPGQKKKKHKQKRKHHKGHPHHRKHVVYYPY